MNVEFARKLAAFLRSIGQAQTAADFTEWADELESEFSEDS